MEVKKGSEGNEVVPGGSARLLMAELSEELQRYNALHNEGMCRSGKSGPGPSQRWEGLREIAFG